MSIESSMVNYYADRAQEYERIYHKPERQDDLRRLRDLVERTFAGTHVFEVACGTGYWTEIVARSAASVVATDINEEVLRIARSKLSDTPKVVFSKEDAYALPILPQQFTAGFSGFWWSHLPKSKIQDFLRGLHRVLSTGARVVFIEMLTLKAAARRSHALMSMATLIRFGGWMTAVDTKCSRIFLLSLSCTPLLRVWRQTCELSFFSIIGF